MFVTKLINEDKILNNIKPAVTLPNNSIIQMYDFNYHYFVVMDYEINEFGFIIR